MTSSDEATLEELGQAACETAAQLRAAGLWDGTVTYEIAPVVWDAIAYAVAAHVRAERAADYDELRALAEAAMSMRYAGDHPLPRPGPNHSDMKLMAWLDEHPRGDEG